MLPKPQRDKVKKDELALIDATWINLTKSFEDLGAKLRLISASRAVKNKSK